MSSFKQLTKSDVSVVPYNANKQWTLPYNCFPSPSASIAIYKGTNYTGSFVSSTAAITNGEYEQLIYAQVNQLFYQKYTNPLNTSSLANSIYYESASQQRPTSSYFVYNDNDKLIKNFPTGNLEVIRVIAVNQNVYGNKILPNTFVLSSAAYNITDDGYGNLYDGGTTHVGNVFYAHGVAIITNQDYKLMFPYSSSGC